MAAAVLPEEALFILVIFLTYVLLTLLLQHLASPALYYTGRACGT